MFFLLLKEERKVNLRISFDFLILSTVKYTIKVTSIVTCHYQSCNSSSSYNNKCKFYWRYYYKRSKKSFVRELSIWSQYNSKTRHLKSFIGLLGQFCMFLGRRSQPFRYIKNCYLLTFLCFSPSPTSSIPFGQIIFYKSVHYIYY